MRGLVVLVGIVVIGVLILLWTGSLTSADPNNTNTISVPTKITCTVSHGTVVTFKPGNDVTKVRIGDYCKRDFVPANWVLQCYTDKELSQVNVSFVERGVKKESRVVCS